MVKAIFWDNDGVLVDTEHLYFKATKQILSTIGFELTQELYVELFMVQGGGAWRLLAENGYSEEQINKLRTDRNDLYVSMLSGQNTLIDGAKEVLDDLAGRYLMGIVTSSRKYHFDVTHQSTGLLKYFNFVLTAEDFTNFKPHPEPYLMALEKSGYSKDECIVIEDSERGLISAKSAGLTCYVIPNELTKASDFSKADKVLNNISEVIDALN
jgi:HAD superfamily hydrolase (TIGR01509 family)